MRDAQTGSEWLHYTGECVVGPMAGKALTMLTGDLTTWRAFRDRHPSATVIANTRSLFRRLMGKFNSGRAAPSFFRLPGWFTRTMTAGSGAAGQMEFGLGVVMTQRKLLGGVRAVGARFYPFHEVQRAGVVNEVVDGTPVVVVWDAAANAAVAFVPRLGERTLQLRRGDDGVLVDGDLRVDDTGRVLSGEGAGQRLPVLLGVHTRWYGFQQVHRDATVYRLA